MKKEAQNTEKPREKKIRPKKKANVVINRHDGGGAQFNNLKLKFSEMDNFRGSDIHVKPTFGRVGRYFPRR